MPEPGGAPGRAAPAPAAAVPADEELRAAAESVPDPELPVLTLAELGVLRELRTDHAPARMGDAAEAAPRVSVEVDITPTYTGCPALETMATDLEAALRQAGAAEVTVRTVLSPAWSTDDITDAGRRKLAAAGIAPPRPTGPAAGGPVGLTLTIRCPHCGSTDTTLLSRFSSTACKALRRCDTCREPFDHVKEL
ncbi:phenylacetate-CoA oxygenase subunit PaaJ [Streptomyces lonarensis]|uniref:Phenylacetate-CoA oxygenase subunit PaaJ n=1 Tax=Streptomyces lonarensis TaxID=700599 RepID=A0A7X6I174_9ACTN|nr:phenylacetate-CoA oxygenase subunit PaaJ [Streptomyces lonarensis]